MAAAPSEHDCPVCHEEFTEPKLLPCTHLVCRNCIISWLDKGGDQGGCPLCRAAILPAGSESQDDLTAKVDALLTDLAMDAIVQGRRALADPDKCSLCDDREATVFCLQCSVKLCKSCSKVHSKIPATQNHVTEDLSCLTAERLAAHHQSSCASHRGRPAELYCADHQELLCLLCASSTHRKCADITGVAKMASVKREELNSQGQRLKDKEDAISAEIIGIATDMTNTTAKFKAMKDEVKVTFDDLQRVLDKRRQEVLSDIQEKEEAFLKMRKSTRDNLERYKSSLSANRTTAERLMETAPDSSLLAMAAKLKSRLDDVELQENDESGHHVIEAVTEITFDREMLNKFKKALESFGQLQYSASGKVRALWQPAKQTVPQAWSVVGGTK